ncbi:SLC13 family permease, partial [Bacteroidota bacterium]
GRQSKIIIPLILAIFICFFVDLDPENENITYTFAIALLMASWWITEAIPLAITSLIPVALFPLLGVMNGKLVSSAYFNHVIFLFIGGFIVALAMEKWNLHKRIALKLLIIVGIRPGSILLGFMLASSILSMWISNTATAMMMVPIVLSVIKKLEEEIGREDLKKFTIALLLGVAYGASIGGIATLVGTPPNLSFVRIYAIMFPEAAEISFGAWFLFAFPISFVLFIIVWIYLYVFYKPRKNLSLKINKNIFASEYKLLGPMSLEEKIVLTDFILLAFLWLSRSGFSVGNFNIPGWSDLFAHPEYINDGTVAIFMSLLLFLLPSKKPKQRIMDWKTTVKIPWNIVLLFGGGFALATAFKESGLSLWIGEQLIWVESFHPILIVLAISLVVTFLTELTSNTATIEMLLPVLAGIAISLDMNPLILMLPATLSASLAFMLPVATPPNAIIFGTNRIKMKEMAKAGVLLNLIGAVVVCLATYFLGQWIFGFDIMNL